MSLVTALLADVVVALAVPLVRRLLGWVYRRLASPTTA